MLLNIWNKMKSQTATQPELIRVCDPQLFAGHFRFEDEGATLCGTKQWVTSPVRKVVTFEDITKDKIRDDLGFIYCYNCLAIFLNDYSKRNPANLLADISRVGKADRHTTVGDVI